MKKIKIFCICFMVFCLSLVLIDPMIGAQGKEYKLNFTEWRKLKAWCDDPRPYRKDLYKKLLPPEIYAKLIFDIEGMKKAWTEVIGFKSPDVVGQIAPRD